MKFTAHLSFNGQCEAAFQTYQRLFGGRIITMLRYGDSPLAVQFAPAMHSQILHATLDLGGQTLFGTDVPIADYRPAQGFSVTANCDEIEQSRRVFAGLAEGGVISMTLQETFWSAAFGLVTDRFGIPWEINCEQPPATSPD